MHNPAILHDAIFDGSGMVAGVRQVAIRRRLVDWMRDVMERTEMSGHAWAVKAGLSPSTISRFLKDPVHTPMPSTSTLAKLAAAVGEPPPELHDKVIEPAPEIAPRLLPRDVPVYGVAQGGQGGSFAMNGETVDFVRRPPGIEKARGVFGIFVVGTSMSPRFEPGDLLYLHPDRPAQIGCDVVVELHGKNGDPGECFLKRLKGRKNGHVVLEQFNPPGDMRIAEDRVRRIYRVLTNNELFGV